METKELKIQVPEGYEIDKENSTFECIKFKPIKKKLTYEDVAKEMFEDKVIFYINAVGAIVKGEVEKEFVLDPNNCTSKKQAEKLFAINKLVNVAKYLNGEWEANWNEDNLKYFIGIKHTENIITIGCSNYYSYAIIYFESKELAQQAIEILGEETIKTALSTDW